MVRDRCVAGNEDAYSRRAWLILTGALLVVSLVMVSACAKPVRQGQFESAEIVVPVFRPSENLFLAHDGAPLGLTVFGLEAHPDPSHVIVAVHGMNDYANAFHLSAPRWAESGIVTYAYDQRGFGRSPRKGIWPEEELMREDVRTAVRLTREAHPDAVLTLVGMSMGAAVSITALASDTPPDVDRFIASGPGLRGWGALNPLYRGSLWLSTHTRPSWIVKPPRKFVHIEPSDNVEMLRVTWSDPLMTYENRIDQVYGVVSLMENAHKALPNLPSDLPTLFTYGENDYVIPDNAMKRSAKILPEHARTALYKDGYHMLLRDLTSQKVHDDYTLFMLNPEKTLPSGAPEWKW